MRRLFSLSIFVWCLYGLCALANPQGPQVIHGQVNFNAPDAGVLNITNSPNAIINWQSFGINAGEVTQFIQQSSTSAVLNRIVGQDPSAILGHLLSNGRVFLINPNGIVFGPDSVVDTAGLVASTLNMTDQDFLEGKLDFEAAPDAGAINNQGFIKAGENGSVFLIAPNIENSGVIQADGGRLLLAAGEKVTIGSLDNEDVVFEVQAPDNEVVNLGTLLSRGGAAEIFAATIRHSGEINADTIALDQAGRIVLSASKDITLEPDSLITASGAPGGIHAGGDVRIIAEDTLDMRRGAEVHVDGGPDGGDGGRLELSGKQAIALNGDYTGRAQAEGYVNGDLVIDPLNIELISLAGVASVAQTDLLFHDHPPVLSPDGTRLYVSNQGAADHVSVIDTATNTEITTIPVGNDPKAMAISPDGMRLYVANESDGTVSVIDTGSNTVITPVAVGSLPFSVLVNPAGTRVYVSNRGASDTVSVIDAGTNGVIATVNVDDEPGLMALTATGDRLYVANQLGDTVTVIDTATNTMIDADPIAPGVNPISGIDGAYSPTLTPDGTRLYVAAIDGGEIASFDTTTFAAAAPIPTATFTFFMDMVTTPSGQTKLYAAELFGDVRVIDAASATEIATITGLGGLNRLSASPTGDRVFIASEGSDQVFVIDTVSDTVVRPMAVGDGPASPPAVAPDGRQVYTFNWNDDTVSAIGPPTGDTGGDGVVASGDPPVGGTLQLAPESLNGAWLNVQLWATGTLTVVDPLRDGDIPVGGSLSLIGNDMFVNAAIGTAAVPFAHDLNLEAGNGLAINAPLFTSGALGVFALPAGATANADITAGSLNIFAGTGALTLNGTTTIDTLTMSGGTLTGTGDVYVGGTFTWTGGTLSGSGSTNVLPGGMLIVTGAGTGTIDGGTLTSAGGAGSFWDRSTTTFLNDGRFLNTGTLELRGSPNVGRAGGFPFGTFTNTGTLQKTAGTARLDIPFDNTGLVETLGSSFLSFDNGSALGSSGEFSAQDTSLLQYGAGTHVLLDGASFTGTGTNYISGGTISVAPGATIGSDGTSLLRTNAGTLDVGAGAVVNLHDFRLAVGGVTGAGDVNIGGTFTWDGNGTLSGSGSTNVLAGGILEVTGISSATIDGRTLTSAGGAGSFWERGTTSFQGDAQFLNTGILELRGSPVFGRSGGFPFGTVTNAGTWQKTGGGTATVDVAFDNTGLVQAPDGGGLISLDEGSTAGSSGEFNAAGIGAIRFNGATHTLLDGASFTGTGTISIVSGAVQVDPAAGIGSGASSVLSMTGGTLDLGAGAVMNLNDLSIVNATLSGAGDVNLGGLFTWGNGASLSGAGSTNVLAGGTLIVTGAGSGTIDGRSLSSAGGAGSFWERGTTNFQGDAQFLNTGILELRGSPVFGRSGGFPFGTVTNAGTLQKTGGGTAALDAAFDNTGLVQAPDGGGLISLDEGSTAGSSGEFNAVGAGAIRFNGGTHTLLDGASFTGTGTTTIASGTVQAAAGATVGSGVSSVLSMTGGTLGLGAGAVMNLNDLSIVNATLSGAGDVNLGGIFTWGNGASLSGAGSTNVLAGGILEVTGISSATIDGRTLTSAGGAGSFWERGTTNFQGDAQFLNTGILELRGSPVFGRSGGFPFGTVTNAGTWQKTGGGTATVDVAFDNTGLVQAPDGGGLISLDEGSTAGSSGEFNAVGAGAIRFNGGTHTLLDGASFTGTGTTTIASGTVQAAAGATVGSGVSSVLSMTGGTLGLGAGAVMNLNDLSIVNATLSGAGDVNLGGIFTWGNGASLSGAGSTNVLAGGILEVTGISSATIDGRTLTSAGGAGSFWERGTTNFQGDAQFLNTGILELRGSPVFGRSGGFPFGTVTNAGTWQKTGGGTATVDVAFDNTGLVQAPDGGGLISLDEGSTAGSSGEFNAVGAGAIRFNGGTHTLLDGASFTGTGTTTIASGTVQAAAGATVGSGVSSVLSMTGGTLGLGAGAVMNLNDLSIVNATLSGAGDVNLGGIFTWGNGANLSGAGSTNVLAGGILEVTGISSATIDGRTLTSAGGAGSFWERGTTNFQGDAQFLNTGILELRGSPVFGRSGGFPFGTVTNAGTLQKTGGGTAALDVAFDNTGLVQAPDGGGLISLDEGSTAGSSGEFNAVGAGAIRFNGGTHTLLDNARISGAGTTEYTGGGFDIVGMGTGLTIANGTSFTLTGRSLGGPGKLVNQGTLTLDNTTIGGSLDNQSTLTIAGNSSVNGASLAGTAGTITIPVGATLTKNGGNYAWGGGTLLGNGNLVMAGGAVFTLAGAGDRIVDGLNLNLTDMTIPAGTMTVNSGTVNAAGTTTVSAGAGLIVNGGLVDATGPLDMPGGLTLNNGTMNVAGTMTVPAGGGISVNGGLLDAAGPLDMAGNLVLAGGTVNAAGTTTVSAGGVLNIGSGLFDATGLVDLAGTLALTGGNVNVAPLQINGGLLAGNGMVTGNVFVNSGAIAPSASIGTLSVLGDVTFGNGSNFDVDLGLDAMGVEISDVLDVAGNAFIDTGASLNILAFGGYPGSLGDTFAGVMTASGIIGPPPSAPPGTPGQFDTVTQAATFDVTPSYTAGPPGDLSLTVGAVVAPPPPPPVIPPPSPGGSGSGSSGSGSSGSVPEDRGSTSAPANQAISYIDEQRRLGEFLDDAAFLDEEGEDDRPVMICR